MKKLLFLLVIFLFSSFIFGCVQTEVVSNQGNENMDHDTEVPEDLKTDDHGTEVAELSLDEHQQSGVVTYGDGFSGYFVQPNEPGDYPGVVMIHEWWGLNDNVKQEAHNLAEEGYLVLAVDLYDGNVADNPGDARKYASSVRNNMEGAIEHMKAAGDFLRNQKVTKLASMGWCFGGQMSLQYGLNEDLDATVIYYGNLETDEEVLSSLEQPVLGVFGELDKGIPPNTVRSFESALDSIGIENEIYIYDGVGHAFANPSNPGHDPAKTKDAWDKTVLFLNRNLKG